MVQRPPPQQQLKRVLAEAAVAGGRLPTKTSTAASVRPHRGSRPAHHRRRTRTFVCLRPHLSDCHLGSSRLQPQTPAAHSIVFVRLNARRFDDAFACVRDDDEDWVDGWHCWLSCADGKRATLVSHLYPAREPPAEFLKKSTTPTGRPSAPTSTAGAQLTSSRSSPGTLGLHAALVSALWPTTLTDPGTAFASRREQAS